MEASQVNKTHFSNANKEPIQRFFLLCDLRDHSFRAFSQKLCLMRWIRTTFYLWCDIRSWNHKQRLLTAAQTHNTGINLAKNLASIKKKLCKSRLMFSIWNPLVSAWGQCDAVLLFCLKYSSLSDRQEVTFRGYEIIWHYTSYYKKE